MKYLIFGNFGDPTIALVQWAKEQNLSEVTVASVDTGWAAVSWKTRVEQGQRLAGSCGFSVLELKAKAGYAELVQSRQEFPTPKFQWCPLLLKGLPLLEYLDEIDPRCLTTIILPKRRSPINPELPEFIEQSEHYGDRKVWQPLFAHTDAELSALVKRAGFSLAPEQRSLECDPCIYNQKLDFLRLAEEDRVKLVALESAVGKPMFAKPINEMIAEAQSAEAVDTVHLGCADPYACGV